MLANVKKTFQAIFSSANMTERRPLVDAHYESNVAGLYVVGDLSGAPVIKLAMEQGYNVIHWTKSGMAYWAVSDLIPQELEAFTELLRNAT